MMSIPLRQWVNDHNPAPELEYAKGWWDAISFFYRLAEDYPDAAVDVIATTTIETPPPTERLLMPVIRLQMAGLGVALLHDFSAAGPWWTASVQRPAVAGKWLYNLVDVDQPAPDRALAAFPSPWRSGSFARDATRFSCQLDDEYAVFTFLWILAHPDRKSGQAER
jgi:hypothetical protein